MSAINNAALACALPPPSRFHKRWPEKTYDLAWSVEVLEHVGRPFMRNYQAAFHKAAIIFVTFASTGGWHHVEVHQENW